VGKGVRTRSVHVGKIVRAPCPRVNVMSAILPTLQKIGDRI
jgi:hypothetical protein